MEERRVKQFEDITSITVTWFPKAYFLGDKEAYSFNIREAEGKCLELPSTKLG